MVKPITYRAAGVDIDAGDALVERIRPFAKATRRKGSMDDLGGFGALFDLKKCGYRDPVLVSSTDGVGTKLKIAQSLNRHETIGIDLVAMCVNDLIVQGAEPLFFLDYFATGKLDAGVAEKVIRGIAAGCRQAGCALIGGETAEMPGMYANGEYDLAGFAVGVVERKRLLPKKKGIKKGDVVLGLASSGLHSNGYSLVRHIMAEVGLRYDSLVHLSGRDKPIGDVLLTPTRIYVQSILGSLKKFPNDIKALAHITGGGLQDNMYRVIPETLRLDAHWEAPRLFKMLQEMGNVPWGEMSRTFNMGIGLAIIVSEAKAEAVMKLLKKSGETVLRMGHLVPRHQENIRIT